MTPVQIGWVLGLLLAAPAAASEKLLHDIPSPLVPSPVEYALLAPEGFKEMKDLPLILNLNGGGGTRRYRIVLPPWPHSSPTVTHRTNGGGNWFSLSCCGSLG